MNKVGPPDRRRGRLRQPEVADLAFLYQPGHGTDGALNGGVAIDAVLIIKVNVVETETPEAGLAGLTDVFRPAVDSDEAALGIPDVAELGCQEDVGAPPPNCPPHQLLIAAGAVGVG